MYLRLIFETEQSDLLTAVKYSTMATKQALLLQLWLPKKPRMKFRFFCHTSVELSNFIIIEYNY